MGEPIRILDLAREMIRLHGFEPDREIKIEFIGLRPGEKLYEELITEGEGIVPTGRRKIMVLRNSNCRTPEFRRQVDDLIKVARQYDGDSIRSKLMEMVEEYHPDSRD